LSDADTSKTATSKIYNEKRTMLSRLEEKLGLALAKEDLDNATREALSALSFVHQDAQQKIHRELERIMILENTKKKVKGSVYAQVMEWGGVLVALLAVPALFTLSSESFQEFRRTGNWAPLSPVTSFLVLGFLLIVVGAFVEFYTKELEREKIEKEINAIEAKVESFSRETWDEAEIVLQKLADQIRFKKDKANQEALKQKIQTYFTAYKEATMEEVGRKFKIDVTEAKALLLELVKEGKMKGIFKNGGRFVVSEK